MELAVVVYVQRSGPRDALVKRNTHFDNVLRFVEVIFDPATPGSVDDISLARPARVPPGAAVPSVFGYAPVWAAAISVRVFRVVTIGSNVDGGPFTRVDEG